MELSWLWQCFTELVVSRRAKISNVMHQFEPHSNIKPEFVNQMSQTSKSGLKNIIKPRNKTIFSGIQPTGIPHLGNYLGALKGWVNQQNEAESSTNLIYSLVDLHAITIKQDPYQLRQWRKESLAVLLAVGLDPKRSTIFFQSHV